MLGRLLGDRTKRVLAEEREWLAKLQRALARFDTDPADLSTLDRSIAQLDRLFLLVVIGEFNAGKSAFINALTGQRVLEEGPTPTTTRLQILRYGDTAGRHIEQGTTAEGVDVISAPVALLRDLDIVDTPGTNAIFREHEKLTTEFVPQADLVLFVTSADRPFTESERAFLEAIRNWGKKIVIVINKVDILDRDEDRHQVRQFVADQAQRLLGTTPEMFMISARHALKTKLAGTPHQPHSPNLPDQPHPPIAGDQFADLERYIAHTLDQKERLRLKLLNPVGIALNLSQKVSNTIRGRLELLTQDRQTIEDIEGQLNVYRSDLAREFEFRLAEVDNILQQFENRGVAFFDDTLRIGRVMDLLNKARMQRDFERQVVGDTPQQIEKQVHDVIDWMVASELRQWQAVTEHVKRRQTAHEGRITGGDTSQFIYDRKRLMDTVGRVATKAVQTYDKEHEASIMAESVRTAVAGAALAQAGAVSLGTLVTLLASTTAADVTGLIAAGSLAVLGMFVIPSKRAQAKAQLRQRIAEMREELMTNLRAQFQKEVDRSVHGVLEAVGPYTRFVRAENDKLTELQREIAEISAALSVVRAEIDHAA